MREAAKFAIRRFCADLVKGDLEHFVIARRQDGQHKAAAEDVVLDRIALAEIDHRAGCMVRAKRASLWGMVGRGRGLACCTKRGCVCCFALDKLLRDLRKGSGTDG